MWKHWRLWLSPSSPAGYGRRPPLVLINGLAEQAESWFSNQPYWRRHFEVYTPNLLVYDGPSLHRRIATGRSISVPYLVSRLRRYLDDFVQAPPYHLVASSLGAKVAVEFAARHPRKVSRLVLLAPAGLTGGERLPLLDGVRWHNAQTVIDGVVHDSKTLDGGLLDYYTRKFADRHWRRGLLRTIRGTQGYSVRDRLPDLPHETLVVCGRLDQIVDSAQVAQAVPLLPRGRLIVLDRCSHAPQLERPQCVNPLVVRFLTGTPYSTALYSGNGQPRVSGASQISPRPAR